MTRQDQQHHAGQGGGASDRRQCQVRLTPGQRVRLPQAGRSPVPRHVTGTMAHVFITPARSRPVGHCNAAHQVIAAVHGHCQPGFSESSQASPAGFPAPPTDWLAQRLLHTDPPATALNATQVIWRFFAAHSKVTR
jgi:hypothetical protein